MLTFNDILDSGTMFQGPLVVARFWPDGCSSVVYDGDGEDVPRDETWGEGCVSHIYHDSVNDVLTVEIEVEA